MFRGPYNTHRPTVVAEERHTAKHPSSFPCVEAELREVGPLLMVGRGPAEDKSHQRGQRRRPRWKLDLGLVWTENTGEPGRAAHNCVQKASARSRPVNDDSNGLGVWGAVGGSLGTCGHLLSGFVPGIILPMSPLTSVSGEGPSAFLQMGG